MVTAQVTISKDFGKALDALRAEVRSLSTQGSPLQKSILQAAAPVDARQNERTFAREADPTTGEAWQTLEAENKGYAAWKRRNWPNRKMLVWNGRLRDSTRRATAEGRVARFQGSHLQLGTSDKNAAKHQHGETYAPPLVKYLKEKTPVPQKGSITTRFLYRSTWRVAKTGRLMRRNEYRTSTRPRAPRRWFRLVMDELPSRPFIGKDAAAVAELKAAITPAIIRRLGEISSKYAGRRARLSAAAAAGRLRRA